MKRKREAEEPTDNKKKKGTVDESEETSSSSSSSPSSPSPSPPSPKTIAKNIKSREKSLKFWKKMTTISPTTTFRMFEGTKVEGVVRVVDGKVERLGVEELKTGYYSYNSAFLRGSDILYCCVEGEIEVEE
uniref:Uncharacterized protein n=1 Tax=Paramoeba aestuarina TaxID=180227 RepID=A0A7S4KVB7_9EUKA|mmetsp:Transcript_26267/g.40938  ORF Transcript_26267/g.40938 Transcript_26267/m.40938 type:complete len:131 (+) Transcript_26267:29-421(+)